MAIRNYGVFYTPKRLADFVAMLLFREASSTNTKIKTILDPACGEFALLHAVKDVFGSELRYVGIDVDKKVLQTKINDFEVINNDSIMPRNVKRKAAEFWRTKLPKLSAIIANPPWSSEKIYEREELKKAGYSLAMGQYDSFVLFIELAYKLLEDGGYFAFIIPDSLFDAQNTELRRYLTNNVQIKVIARLGEKIFEEVNRATTVIVCQKQKPTPNTVTHCFRLDTTGRRAFLSSDVNLIELYDSRVHDVLQSRFAQNSSYNFDIDTYSEEEGLLAKIRTDSINWEQLFVFGRGVEISKSGKIVVCPKCEHAQGFKKIQLENGAKTCTNCGNDIEVTDENIKTVISRKPTLNTAQIFVGENVRRYEVNGEYYIEPCIHGINYKNREMYAPPKLLIRKTGLGIYASIDYSGSLTSQTVYILKLKDQNSTLPLEYYLAMLNSRVVYYYYLKMYGENEWKSHPYLTKQIIYSLPIRRYENSDLDRHIVEIAVELSKKYSYSKDLMLERLIMEKYDLSADECKLVFDEMNKLPNLSAINNMKVEN